MAEACPTAGGADQVTGDQIRGERAGGQEEEVERGNDTVGRRGNAREGGKGGVRGGRGRCTVAEACPRAGSGHGRPDPAGG